MTSSVIALFSVNPIDSVNFVSVKVMLHCTYLTFGQDPEARSNFCMIFLGFLLLKARKKTEFPPKKLDNFSLKLSFVSKIPNLEKKRRNDPNCPKKRTQTTPCSSTFFYPTPTPLDPLILLQ